MAKSRKSLVVDTSIAQAVGTTDHPTSSACRNFLFAFKKQSFRIVVSSEIWGEWKEHASPFFLEWFKRMTIKRRDVDVGNVKNQMLRGKIRDTSITKKHQNDMEKDCLLLEAALATDKIVFSLDNVKDLFRNAANHADLPVHEIKPIHWANPDSPKDDVITWLERGAPTDKTRQLGYTGSKDV